MLKWVIGVVAAVAFFWGLNRILIALTTQAGTVDLVLGLVGAALAGLSFIYFGLLLGQVQKGI
ncbi:MAG: hypothetical protein ACLFSW_02150 [Halobacteriales archaeon]